MRKIIKSLMTPALLYRYRAYRAFWKGERELRILKDLISTNRVAIDVGANYGEYAYWLEKLCYKVVLFEPHPECVEFLTKCVSPSTDIYQMGLSNINDESILRIPIVGNSSAMTCRASLSSKAVSEFNYLDALAIRFVRLDVANISGVCFIKSGVDVHEREIMRGAGNGTNTFMPS